MMRLISCKACDQKVSLKAKTCPSCGEPVSDGPSDLRKCLEAISVCAGIGTLLFSGYGFGAIDILLHFVGTILLVVGLFGFLIRL